MSQAILERLTAERAEIEQFVTRTLEGVEGRDLSDAELRTIETSKTRISEIDAQIAPLQSFMEARNAAADLTRTLGRSEQRASVAETRSWGEQFVSSDVFADYRGRGTSARFQIESRALPTGLAEIADVLPQKQRVDVTPPNFTPLLDAISTINVSQNGIETVVWEKVAGGAAKVPEKTAKPSVEFAPTVVPFTLDTIAVHTILTRAMIEDAPAVRSTIDSMLRREVALKMEAEAAAALVAATLPTASSDTLLKAIRQGVGVVQSAGYNPNVVVLNPADWADLDIDVFTGTLGGPSVGQRFWGLTPIAAVSQPAGTATVGDLSAGVQRYARTGINLYVTDSHADLFLSNCFALLSEGRAKTIVTRPAALVECAKTA